MPLIAYRDRKKKVPFKIEIVEEIHKQMQKYCEWAGIEEPGFFIEEAAKYIFSQDKLWAKYLDSKSVNNKI